MTPPQLNLGLDPVKEEWRAVAAYEGLYEVSSLGRVRSLDAVVRNRHGYRPRHGRVLTQTTNSGGYKSVYLSQDSIVTTIMVHRLVAEAFIPNPHGLPEVNHDDLNKDNNRVGNLLWSTSVDNAQHHARTGLRARKLTADNVRLIKARLATGEIPRYIAPDFDVNISTVYAIVYGKIWRHVNVTDQTVSVIHDVGTSMVS